MRIIRKFRTIRLRLSAIHDELPMNDASDRKPPLSTALIGGSFDPVHLGHLHLVHCVATYTGYERILLVPVAMNNFKQNGHRPAPPDDRLAMLRLAVDGYRELYPADPRFDLIVDSCELDRGGVSYTYDTVRYIYDAYAVEGRVAVVMGDDLLEGLPRWHRFDELKRIADFVVCKRTEACGHVPSELLRGARIRYIDNAVFEDSATLIRDRLGAFPVPEALPGDVASLMPKKVADYVQSRHLYRT